MPTRSIGIGLAEISLGFKLTQYRIFPVLEDSHSDVQEVGKNNDGRDELEDSHLVPSNSDSAQFDRDIAGQERGYVQISGLAAYMRGDSPPDRGGPRYECMKLLPADDMIRGSERLPP